MNKILLIGEDVTSKINTSYEVIYLSKSDIDSELSEHFVAIIICIDEEPLFSLWLSKLRHCPLNFSSLIYSSIPDFADMVMVDGLMPQDIDAPIANYIKRAEEVKINDHDNLENKLLTYLWVVEGRRLEPKRRLDKGVSNQYPFLELWDNNSDKEFWLNRIVKGNILKQEDLIDRIRQCVSCASSSLNYVDSCSHCGSIDLKIEQALHCFSCGHIADQKEFIRTGEMVCPNCFNTLRHIGTDYDRPIENQRCNNCDSLSMDTNVKAECFNCGHDNAVDDLIQKEYFSFSIGHNGIIKIKTGTDPQEIATILGEEVSREHFSWMANWLNKMATRQDEQHLFIALKFDNLLSLTHSMSITALTAQLDEFSMRLRAMLRATDIFCQYNDNILYFLLPNVPEENIKTIETKLANLSEEQSENTLNLNISLKLLPQPNLSSDVELWLAECAMELEK